MRASRGRQLVFDAAMRVPRRGAARSLTFELLMRIVRRGPGAGDALVRYRLGDDAILIPVEHEIARYRKYWSGYGENLARVAREVHAKYPDMSAIDVGANVGDSAVLLRQGAPVPVLCVEGDPRFARILRHNLAGTPDLRVEETFIGPAAEEAAVSIESAGGSLWLERTGSEDAQVVRFRTLRELLAEHGDMPRPRLLKVDTDGFDCDILVAERQTLADLRPVVFFEYAPDMYREPGGAYAVFGALAAAGYEQVLAYLNHGEFLVGARIDDSSLLEDLHAHVTGHAPYGQPSLRYLDICAFHADDADLWHAVRAVEHAAPEG